MPPIEDLNGVTPSETPSDDEVISPDPESAPGNEPVDNGDTDRPDKNVLSEFNRKFSKSQKQQDALSSQLAQVTDNLSKLVSAMQSGAVSPTYSNAPTPAAPTGSIKTMTVSQLQELKLSTQVSPTQRMIIDQEIQQRIADETFTKRFTEQTQQQGLQKLKEQSIGKAVKLYPELHNDDSEFYQRVDRALADRRALLGPQPTDLLDVANEVAQEMGKVPTTTARPRKGGFVAPGHGNAPHSGPGEPLPYELTGERFDKLSKTLQSALPDGKKFSKESVMKNSRVAAENANLFLKGGQV